jgi:hypothetical protein
LPRRIERLVAALALLSFAVIPAIAAPSGGQRVAAAESIEERKESPVLSPASDMPAAPCPRVRRRLWVEGEGWIVRRVSSCH